MCSSAAKNAGRLLLILFLSSPAHAQSVLTGTVTHVRDGDTIEVSNTPIRLNGVAAPERKDPLGPQATAFMRDLVLGKEVRCELNGKKTYDRFVGRCFLRELDVGRELIGVGLARDCPRYSRRRYEPDEVEARRNGKDVSRVYRLPGYCRRR